MQRLRISINAPFQLLFLVASSLEIMRVVGTQFVSGSMSNDNYFAPLKTVPAQDFKNAIPQALVPRKVDRT
jgi:hypothetical protein